MTVSFLSKDLEVHIFFVKIQVKRIFFVKNLVRLDLPTLSLDLGFHEQVNVQLFAECESLCNFAISNSAVNFLKTKKYCLIETILSQKKWTD